MQRIGKDEFVRTKMYFNDEASLRSSFDTRSLERVIYKGEGYLCFSDTKVSEFKCVCFKTSITLAEEIFAAHRADEKYFKETGKIRGAF